MTGGATIQDQLLFQRRNIALEFIRLAASSEVQSAHQLHAAEDFRHHNGYFPGDANSLMRAMEKNAIQFPQKRLDIKRTIAEGEFVVVHSHVILKPGDSGAALCHIFRFDGLKVAELWDIGQPVPDNSPNQYGMF